MDEKEKNVRNYLKELTMIDKKNSSYLAGVDFDTEPMESILRKIDSLDEEVDLLEEMIHNHFPSTDGYPRPEPLSQQKIIEDYKKKSDVLQKIRRNWDLFQMLMIYKSEREKESHNNIAK
jgi:hypothetical protein